MAIGVGCAYANKKASTTSSTTVVPEIETPTYVPPKGGTTTNGKTGNYTGDTTTGNPGTTAVPSQPSAPAIPLPQPCPIPVPRGWNDLSDTLKRMMISIGALSVFKYMIDTIKWDYKYKNVNGEDHHIVPWNSKYRIDDKYNLENSRNELMKVNIIPRYDTRNIVHISARLHNRTKNKVYNGYIAKKFYPDCSKKFGYITWNLAKLKMIFKLVDNTINIYK